MKEFIKKLEKYIKSRLNKNIDIDGKFGSQCVDLVRDYAINVIGEDFKARGWAKRLWWKDWGKNWRKIPYKPGVIPKTGDIVIWGGPKTKYGHIAIILKADEKGFTVLEQNTGNGDGIGYDDRVRIHTYPYIGYKPGVKIEGFVRHKSLDIKKGTYETIYGDDLGIRDYSSLHKAILNKDNPREAIYATAIVAKSVLVNLQGK